MLLCAAQGVVTANEAFQKCLIDKCLFKVNADEMDYELTACEAHQCDMSCAQETGYNVDEAKVRCRRFEASEPSCELECGANSNRLTGTLMPNEATLLPERIGDEGNVWPIAHFLLHAALVNPRLLLLLLQATNQAERWRRPPSLRYGRRGKTCAGKVNAPRKLS